MHSIRRWLYKPKKGDKSLLAQFYYADEELSAVTAELDSLDGKKDPEKCTILVAQLRQCQDKVLNIITEMMDYVIPNDRAPRDFRVKYPDDVLQDNLAGQLWFGAECLAAGSNILNREAESSSMRPLAKAVVRNLDKIRSYLHEQCLSSYPEYTEKTRETFKIFDRLLADFEFTYVSAMVPVKSLHEYSILQDVTVLFSETLQRALRIGLLNQDQVDTCDPALMFTVPRLAILAGLIFFPSGPLQLEGPPENMSELFRPFRNLLRKIRKLLLTLTVEELCALEKVLCSMEEPKEIRLKNGENPGTSEPLVQAASTPQVADMGLAAYCAAVPDHYFQNFFSSHPECRALLRPTNRVTVGGPSTIVNNAEEKRSTLVTTGQHRKSASTTTATSARTSTYRRDGSGQALTPNNDAKSDESDETSSSSDTDDDAGRSSSASGSEGVDGEEDDDEEDDTASSSVSSGGCAGTTSMVSRIEEKLEGPTTTDPSNNSEVMKLPTISCSCVESGETAVGMRASGDTAAVMKKNTKSDERRSSNRERARRGRVGQHSSQRRTVSEPGEHRVHHKHHPRVRRQPMAASSVHLQPLESDEAVVARLERSRGDVPEMTESSATMMILNASSALPVNAACADDEAIALALQACELADREQIRSRFRNINDLIHRLFVCISGIADQLQTNFAGDLRSILKAVFLMNATPIVESADSSSVDSAEEALDGSRVSSDEGESPSTSTAVVDHDDHPDHLAGGDDGCALCNGDPEDVSVASSSSPRPSSAAGDRSDSPNGGGGGGGAVIRSKAVRRNVIHYLHPQVSHTIGSDIPYYPPDRFSSSTDGGGGDGGGGGVGVSGGGVPIGVSAVVGSMESTLQSPLAGTSPNTGAGVPIVGREQDFQLPSSPSLASSYNSSGERAIRGPNWVPDSSAPDCMGCQAPFTVVRRRHHCRSCGKVFCSKCSRNSVPLPQFGHKKPVRVCNRCFVYQVNPFTLQEVL